MNSLNFTLVLNLLLSIANVCFYIIGYRRVSTARVDGKLKLTKIALLFELCAVMIFAFIQATIYGIVLFDRAHIREALYLENLAILFFNIAFSANAFLLAIIVGGLPSRRK